MALNCRTYIIYTLLFTTSFIIILLLLHFYNGNIIIRLPVLYKSTTLYNINKYLQFTTGEILVHTKKKD